MPSGSDGPAGGIAGANGPAPARAHLHARAVAESVDNLPRRRNVAVSTISGLLWLAVGACALFSVFLGLTGVTAAKSAPQEASAAAMAIACAVIPYVIARAWDETMS